MPDPASPRDVFDRLLAGINQARWSDLPALYAEDATVDQPFAAPRRLRLNGRAEVGAHFEAAARAPFELRALNVVVHEAKDPEVILAEFDYHLRNVATGREETVANVQVLRVRDGLIVASRDYHDHLRLAAAAGQAQHLAAALD
ncbi:nuclear transport factor 2 family protein [Micromonospora halotolerans]|uniref:Nuclear transport factor 2 family protein n=1 Tax=Micromonospora halotolerans TaxID=709879 RepID=A0ABY9ZVY7_9ACTN|nr:nuclear transport factor 2 family protein [Micromonospora halotolerans]WNM39431.1 nuclear transport factor 2 family protein [Micromonospora halotolerans]